MRAFRLAYDGRPFHGFQRQPDVPTVEGALVAALEELGVAGSGAETPPGYAAAGRTDAGVSAVAQTVAFEAPDWCSPAALNGELPGSVRAWAVADAPSAFHATRDAARREYTYRLHAPGETVDDAAARAALEALTGEHDFHNLTPDETGTVRDLSGRLSREAEFLVVTLSAPGFARQLVRRVVSLVRAVGSGAAPPDRIDRILGSDPVEGPDGVGPAPATPLVLTGVAYPDLAFAVDPAAAESARETFDARRVEGLTAAGVAETVLSGIGSAPDTG